MRRTVQALAVVGVVAAGGLLTTGAASASTPARPLPVSAPACGPNVRAAALPLAWIPRNPRETDRRVSWNQVAAWDRNHDNRLSDAELAAFRKANVMLGNGGPRCGQPENPPRR